MSSSINNSGINSRRSSPPSFSSTRSSFRSHHRDDISSSPRSRERMGPPKSVPPRRFRGSLSSSSTSTYRGRGSIIRGIRRPRGIIIRSNEIMRRKFIALKARESIRRFKMSRIRRYCIKQIIT